MKCVGDTKLMLWHPSACNPRMIDASSPADTASLGWLRVLMSAFWQNAQRRLQPEKKIVPEPCVPTSGVSSPKWGCALATVATAPAPHMPSAPANRSAPQRRGHSTQLRSSSRAASTRSGRLPQVTASGAIQPWAPGVPLLGGVALPSPIASLRHQASRVRLAQLAAAKRSVVGAVVPLHKRLRDRIEANLHQGRCAVWA